jgi:acyl-coenzyme A thioesterase PaaI-like protein
MSSLTSGLGGGVFGGASQQASDQVNADQLLTAAKAGDTSTTGSTNVGEVSHGCPKMVVATRDNNITFYEPGRAGDGLAIMHRGEITKTARECQVEPGRVTVKYGFSGRVLLGPRGKPGNVTLPVNVTVTDSKRAKIVGDAMKVDVAIGSEKPIGYFSAVRTVTFEIPEGTRPGEFEMQIGFDNKTPGAG